MMTPREKKLHEARRKAELHRSLEVWTKDPHQPRYYKAQTTTKRLESVVPSRNHPTTNFVGDAMTLGAVEDIAAELADSSSSKEGGQQQVANNKYLDDVLINLEKIAIDTTTTVSVRGEEDNYSLEQIRRTIRAERRRRRQEKKQQTIV